MVEIKQRRICYTINEVNKTVEELLNDKNTVLIKHLNGGAARTDRSYLIEWQFDNNLK